jgi:hypothetical protein
MIAIAQFIAISCYLGAAALAAVPFARPVKAPVAGVTGVLAMGIVAHVVALLVFAQRAAAIPLTGLGPSLSFAGVVLAFTLLLVEFLARDVSLTVVAAPLAAVPTICANIIGLTPGRAAEGVRGVWLFAHIALSFIGIAAFATAVSFTALNESEISIANSTPPGAQTLNVDHVRRRRSTRSATTCTTAPSHNRYIAKVSPLIEVVLTKTPTLPHTTVVAETATIAAVRRRARSVIGA